MSENLARLGDDFYALSSLIRWVHPWKSIVLVSLICVMIIVFALVPFHRLLLCLVIGSFTDGFVHRYKYRAINWYRRECLPRYRRFVAGKRARLNEFKELKELRSPDPVQVKMFGMSLNCSAKSSLHRVRNFLNSMPNDRDLDGKMRLHFRPVKEFPPFILASFLRHNIQPLAADIKDYYDRKRQAVSARNKYMEVSYSGVRYGGIWAGPLQYRWKPKLTDIRGMANDIQALADREYKERFVVISTGYMRLYKGTGDEAAHQAAEGYDELVGCWGTFSLRGACVTVNIQNAVFHIVVAEEDDNHHNPVPRIFLDEDPNQPTSRQFSFRCADEQVVDMVVDAFKRAGCKDDGRKRRSTYENRRGSRGSGGRGRGMSLFRGISTHQTDDDRY